MKLVMEMNWVKIVLVGIFFFSLHCNIAFAGSSCVMLKFTDETRYAKIGSADYLSDLVMEKLLISGQFSIKETRPIDAVSEKYLYDEWHTVKENATIAIETGNYDVIFEGEGFNGKKASTIGAAKKGQTVYPEIMKSIGKKHGADYIIQGTINNFGRASQIKDELGQIAGTVSGVANLFGAGGIASVADIFSDSSTKKQFLGVVVSLRLIRADSGKVVWEQRIIGQSDIKKFSAGSKAIQIGNDKVSGDTYAKAMDDAAETAVKALLEDVEVKKLLLY